VFLFSTLKATGQDWTDWLGASGGPMLRVRLRDQALNAKQHVAAVEVDVRNVWLNYPDVFVEPDIQVGVLQYEIDRCPAVLTTETRITFQKLKPGDHTITVRLLSMDMRLLAPQAQVRLRVP
jgi:hypothetical protein